MNTDELLKLDNQLCFALYVCSKEIIKKYKPILAPLGLTYTGYIAMLSLWEKDNITVSELGDTLYLDSGTLTPLLKKLEEVGLVGRLRSREDERTVVISLTEKGRSLKKKALTVPKDLICAVMQGTNKDEVDGARLISDLHKVMHMLK